MSSPNKKVKKKKGKSAGTPPIDSLQQPPHGASAGDYDGLDGVFEHGSDAGHSDAPSSAHSAEDPDFPNDFITSLGLPTCTGLETLAAMVNASKPAHFHDCVVVARQVLDSGRDLTMVTPGTFEELCKSDFRNEIFQLLAQPRLSLFSVTDVLKAVPLLRDGVAVSVLVATIVAPVKLAVPPLVPAAQQSLLLTSEETKELDSFTKAIEGSKGWNFSKIVTVMNDDRSMTPAAITDLTRTFKKPAGHPGRHYGVPPPGFAQSFVAQPFGPQQQQHGQTQQSLPPFIASGPAPGELPTVMNGSWRYGAETSGSPTGF